MNALRTWTVGAVVGLFSLASLTAQHAPVRVIASNGVKTFVEALVPAYEKSSGRKVTVTYGTSSGLVKDVVGGAAFDVFIATTEAVTQVSQAGKLTSDPHTVLGRSQVGVGVRQGAPQAAHRHGGRAETGGARGQGGDLRRQRREPSAHRRDVRAARHRRRREGQDPPRAGLGARDRPRQRRRRRPAHHARQRNPAGARHRAGRAAAAGVPQRRHVRRRRSAPRRPTRPPRAR